MNRKKFCLHPNPGKREATGELLSELDESIISELLSPLEPADVASMLSDMGSDDMADILNLLEDESPGNP